MAAVALQSSPFLMNDTIFSLLDQSWYSQSILNHSIASSVLAPVAKSAVSTDEVESETALLASEEEGCSTSQSEDRDHTERRKMNGGRRRYSADEAEMRRVFDRFDENADGLICEEELRRYMRCCGKDLSDTEAVSMISSVDVNRDGAVDFEEFLSLYETNCSGRDYLDETRDDAEKPREDEAEEQEERDEELLLEAFHFFDRNQDGFISAQELQAVLLNLGMPEGKSLISCEEMIYNVDRNGDGRCDIHEFQKLMSAQSF